MVSLRSVAPVADNQRVQEQDRSFAAYLAERPVPVDRVERVLLRLNWFTRRIFGQR